MRSTPTGLFSMKSAAIALLAMLASGAPAAAQQLEGVLRPTFGSAIPSTFLPASPPALRSAAASGLSQGPAATPPPEPEHTGWASLLKDTAGDYAAFPRRPSTWVLLAAGGAGAYLAHFGDDYVESHIVGNQNARRFFRVGNVLGNTVVLSGAAVGLWVAGRYIVPRPEESRTNTLSHLGFDLIRAQLVAQGLVHGLKYSVRRDRPTGECCAFPSGHAASAFAMAAVLERHFGYRGSWPALAVATYVATSRMVDNRHFLSDVVFGAALGEAAGWTVVGRHGRSQFAVHPTPVRGGMAIMITRQGE